MEFCEKLQELRKKRGLTQEELAEQLYVSRTAISKWESGRGYPSIDSLKAIAKYFSVSVDDLLSGDTVLAIAEEDRTQSEKRSRTLAFGLLDCSAGPLLFLPFFGIRSNKTAQAVSLLSLAPAVPYIKPLFLAAVISLTLCGIVTLALQNAELPVWQRSKEKVSLCYVICVRCEKARKVEKEFSCLCIMKEKVREGICNQKIKSSSGDSDRTI